MLTELFLLAFLQGPPATKRSFLEFVHDGLNTAKYQACVDNLPCIDLTRYNGTEVPAGKIWTNFPAVTPGDHTVTVIACSADPVCSEPSNMVTFKFVALPNPASELKVIIK